MILLSLTPDPPQTGPTGPLLIAAITDAAAVLDGDAFASMVTPDKAPATTVGFPVAMPDAQPIGTPEINLAPTVIDSAKPDLHHFLTTSLIAQLPVAAATPEPASSTGDAALLAEKTITETNVTTADSTDPDDTEPVQHQNRPLPDSSPPTPFAQWSLSTTPIC